MSQASRQSLSLLALVHWCFVTINDFELAPELAHTIQYGVEVSERCILDFPETGDRDKNSKWIKEKIALIDADLTKNDSLYTAIVLIQLSDQIVTNLCEKIRDKAKLKRIEIVDEVISAVSDKIDDGFNYDAYEEADRLIEKFYSYLGFSI